IVGERSVTEVTLKHDGSPLRRFGVDWATGIPMSASLIGRLGSSAFRLSTTGGADVTRGLVLLFGIGAKALPSWGSKTRWNDLRGGLGDNCRQVQADMRTHLIHRPARD